MTDKKTLILIFLLVHSWWIGPLAYMFLKGSIEGIRERIKEAREQDEPVSSFFTSLGKDGASLLSIIVGGIIKLIVILILLVIVVQVTSFVWDMFFGPRYGPEYEAWRY